jgi:hypothetical protein
MTWLWITMTLAAVLVLLLVAAVTVLLPAASEASERMRIQREAQAASWRIHQHAARAFGEMLDAARQAERGEDR